MPRYSQERKASVLKKLMPPHNLSIPQVSEQEGISAATLYNWRTNLRIKGHAVPGPVKDSDSWSAQAKFAAVVETLSMTEEQLSAYCRSKGLYPEQLQSWKQACIDGTEEDNQTRQQARSKAQSDRKEIQSLEKQLRRKDKALGEAAALLLLQKKVQGLWEDSEDD